jgi:hypothetical protein
MTDDQRMATWQHLRHPATISLGRSSLRGRGEEEEEGGEAPVATSTSTSTSMECVFKEDITRLSIRAAAAAGGGGAGAGGAAGGGMTSGGGQSRRDLFVDGARSSVGLLHFNGGASTRRHMARWAIYDG